MLVGAEYGEEEELRQQPTKVEDRIIKDREVKVNMLRGNSAPADHGLPSEQGQRQPQQRGEGGYEGALETPKGT